MRQLLLLIYEAIFVKAKKFILWLKRDFSTFFVLFRWNKSKTAKKNSSTLMLLSKHASY